MHRLISNRENANEETHSRNILVCQLQKIDAIVTYADYEEERKRANSIQIDNALMEISVPIFVLYIT